MAELLEVVAHLLREVRLRTPVARRHVVVEHLAGVQLLQRRLAAEPQLQHHAVAGPVAEGCN